MGMVGQFFNLFQQFLRVILPPAPSPVVKVGG
jgi:hypothetical protein